MASKFFDGVQVIEIADSMGPRVEFNLRFPPASTGKSHRPQLLHNGRRFLYCGKDQSHGEWVQRNVRVPDSAG